MPLAPNVTVLPVKKKVGSKKPTEEKKKLRVAAYARVSTENEEQEGSYEIQVEYYENLIKATPEWEFVKVYADDGISGTNTDKRSGFMEMIEDCRAGKIDFIITKSISRFARNTVDCLNYTRELKDRNIAVKFEKENINTMDAAGELLLTIMSAMAQQESESLSANVRLGIKFRNERGKVQVNHNWFLGYTKDEEGNLIIDEEQAAVVKRIFREYLDGASCIQIKNGLERDGILNGAGHEKWCDTNIRQILTNEKYIGDAILQKTVTTNILKHKREPNDGTKAPRYYVSENHEPIISREVFMAVRAEMQRRSRLTNPDGKRRNYNARNALGGVLVCASCGDPFRRHVWNVHGKKNVVWRCRNRVLNGPNVCPARTIKEEDLKEAVIRAINEAYGEREELLPELTEALEKALLSGNKAEIDGLTKQMKKLQKKIVSLTDEVDQERVGEEIRSIRERINELRSTDDDYDEEQKRLEEMIAFLKSEGTAIREYDDSLVRKFIDCIMVYDYSIAIRFKTGKEISMRV